MGWPPGGSMRTTSAPRPARGLGQKPPLSSVRPRPRRPSRIAGLRSLSAISRSLRANGPHQGSTPASAGALPRKGCPEGVPRVASKPFILSEREGWQWQRLLPLEPGLPLLQEGADALLPILGVEGVLL